MHLIRTTRLVLFRAATNTSLELKGRKRKEKKNKKPPSPLLLSLHHKNDGSHQSRNTTYLPSATRSTAVRPVKQLIVSPSGKRQLSSSFMSETSRAQEGIGLNGLTQKWIQRETSAPVFIRG